MKYLKEYVVPLFVIVLSLSVFFIFRSVPAVKPWTGYSVVYVPYDADRNIVAGVFEQSGCRNVVCGENQHIPISASSRTPEVSLALSGLESSDYLQKRNMYFFDRNKEYRLYYVPDEFSKRAENAVSVLNSQNILAAMNVSSSFPFIAPAVCILFAAVLVFYSEKKLLCSAVLFLPAFFSFTMPFYSAAAALCLFMYGIFLSLKTWKRDRAFEYLSRNLLVIVFAAASVLFMFMTGIKCAVMFVLLTAGEGCVFFLFARIAGLYDRRYSFVPVKIIPAGMVPLNTKKTNFCLFLCSVSVTVILVFAVFSARIGIPGAAKSVQIPGPCGISGGIPTIKDYVNWRWEAVTFPYISLNSGHVRTKPQNGDKVSFPTYTERNGFIEEDVKVIVFNSDFIENSLLSVDELQYPAIEKMMKLQKNTSAGYISPSSQNITGLTIIILLLSFCISFFFYLMQKKHKKMIILRGSR